MKPVEHQQGSDAWIAWRAGGIGASEVAAVLCRSPYTSRAKLLAQKAGRADPTPENFAMTRGKALEDTARRLYEETTGELVAPVCAEHPVHPWLRASLDGLNFDGSLLIEIKCPGMNDHECALAGYLPEHYMIQMQAQMLVTGVRTAQYVSYHPDHASQLAIVDVRPDDTLQAYILEECARFWQEVEALRADPTLHPEDAPKPIGRTPETLPSLRIEARGMVTASNLEEFKAHALAVLGGINRTLVTDEDFADAEQTVKWCSGVEDRLEAAKASVLGQMADVDAVCRTIDDVAAETRRIRLELDRLVKAEKESRKSELVRAGVDALAAHYADMNRSLGEYAIALDTMRSAEIGASIKGLKTLASMRDKIDAAVASLKIAASQQAERIRACIALLPTHPDHAILFPDRVQLCRTKQPEDLAMLVKHRIDERRKREEAARAAARAAAQAAMEIELRRRLEREVEEAERLREQIRQEEEAKARAEFERGQKVLREEEENVRREDAEREQAATDKAEGGIKGPGFKYTKASQPAARIRLGDINAAIAPLSITADGLAQLGFPHVATDKAAKLYEAASFEQMLSAMAKAIARAELRKVAA